MRALTRAGPSKTLYLDPSHPQPTPSEFPDSYIIHVKACALTREELTWPEPLESEIPIPGYDLAGTIQSLPLTPGPHIFKPGDEVYALTNPNKQGNAREYATVSEPELSLKPKNLGWEDAASVPLSALSGWQALFDHGGLEGPETGLEGNGDRNGNKNKGKKVLVTAAAGGVGIWAVRFAHLAGAELVGTCGTSNVEFVKSLGADRVLNYTETKVLEWVNEDRENREFDVVVDCIGGETLTDAWKCVKEGGEIISIAEPADKKKPSDGVAEGVKGIWFIVGANKEQLDRITELIEEEQCRTRVDSVYKLEKFEEAFERLEGGHAKGKVVLRI